MSNPARLGTCSPFDLRHLFNKSRPLTYVNLGPHPPRLWPEDVDRLHNIWLRLTEQGGVGSKLHHRDVVGVALQRLEEELETSQRNEILGQVENAVQRHDGVTTDE